MQDDPYVYTQMTYTDNMGQHMRYEFPEGDGNEIAIRLQTLFIDFFTESNIRYRMTKDKIFWQKDELECVVEFE